MEDDIKFDGLKYCDNCFTTEQEFISSGFLGCEHCYKVFKKQIDEYISSCQFSDTHIGKPNIKLSQENTNVTIEQPEDKQDQDFSQNEYDIDELKEKQNA